MESAGGPEDTAPRTGDDGNPEAAVLVTCRLCGEDKPYTGVVDIFGSTGAEMHLPQKCSKCLPVWITESDDLSKFICTGCCSRLDEVRKFFEMCHSATQQQVIQYRKTKGSPLDLDTHINQYVRSFNPPLVPHIKLEPTSLCDVDFEVPDGDFSYQNFGYDEDDEDNQNEEEDEDDEDDEDEDIKPELLQDGNVRFRTPQEKIKKKPANKRRGRPKKNGVDVDAKDGIISKRPRAKRKPVRSRETPLALKTCAECGETFDDMQKTLAHWPEKHEGKDIRFRCTEDECKMEAPSQEEFLKHWQDHFPEEGKKQHEMMEGCTICGKSYPRSYLYTRHMQTHSDHKDFKCGTCFKSFKSPEGLKAHSRVHMPDDERYSHCCELCGRRFTQRANLDAHLRVHSGYKPHSCDFCGKCFSQKGNMEEHRRTHTGEKPFVCEICGTAFARRSELQLHNRCQHTHERPFQCAYCPKNFQRRDLLRKHERIHTDTRPYSCQYCQKSFTQRDKMVVHTRLHTGERPYVCDVCGKGFCESGNLKKHLRVHGKDIPKVIHQNNKGNKAPFSGPANLHKQLALQNEISPSNNNQSSNHGTPIDVTRPPGRSNESANASESGPAGLTQPKVEQQPQHHQPPHAQFRSLFMNPALAEDTMSDSASERSITPNSTPDPAPNRGRHPLPGAYAAAAAAAIHHPLLQHLKGDWSNAAAAASPPGSGHHQQTGGN